MADPRLRAALGGDRLIVAPGIFDMISARLADGMGFNALYATGFGTVASHLGLADVGLATYSDMVGRVGAFARMCRTPVIADADTGYGGLLNIRHTVAGYEAAGVTAIQIEDQETPKKCGHTPGRRVIPAPEMALKIEVAVATRKSPDFLVVARTDARTALGLDEAIARGKLYAKAGADVVFVESPETEDEMARIGGEIDAPCWRTWSRAAAPPSCRPPGSRRWVTPSRFTPPSGSWRSQRRWSGFIATCWQTATARRCPAPKATDSAACAR